MELTYSAQTTDFDPDKRYRNPKYFDKPESGVTKVTVVGDWPVVVEAYEAAQVKVDVIEPGGVAETDPTKMGVADLRAWLTIKGVEFDPKAPKADLVKLIPAE